jgi:fyn-related kinase
MVGHYYKSKDVICCRLTKPCPIDQKPVTGGLAKDKWLIPENELRTSEMLGTGRFGKVYRGFWNMKTPTIFKTLEADAADVEQFLKEVEVMKKLVHPKLVQIYGLCTQNRPMFIVIELMENGSLLSYLQSEKGRKLTISLLVDMATQVAEGMSFLEQKNYMHRELAARNVLVGENNIVKITDFGLARAIPNDLYVAKVGAELPIKWMAPEALKFNLFTMKSDVWSFGIFLTELVTYGSVPYAGMQNAEVVGFLENGGRMQCPENCPWVLYDLMLQCWNQDKMKRPSFASLYFMLENIFAKDYLQPGMEYEATWNARKRK